MRSGLLSAAVIGLAAISRACGAADASWMAIATLASGVSPYCAGGQFAGLPDYAAQGDWQVDIRANTLTYARRDTNR